MKDRELIQKATKTKKATVTFTDGMVYKLRYEKKKSLAWGEYEAVFVSPADGTFHPCGWFHIKFLLREE